MSVASLSEKVYCHTPHRVFAGDLASGDRLLNRSLAWEPETRFIPVREAISRLASDGPVEQVAGAFGPILDRQGVFFMKTSLSFVAAHLVRFSRTGREPCDDIAAESSSGGTN